MTDLDELRISWQELSSRLEGKPRWAELRAIYLDLAPLVGQLQAGVSEATRDREERDEVKQAQQSLDRVKAGSKKVGLDMRLSSESALFVGLQTVLRSVEETLNALERWG